MGLSLNSNFEGFGLDLISRQIGHRVLADLPEREGCHVEESEQIVGELGHQFDHIHNNYNISIIKQSNTPDLLDQMLIMKISISMK